MKPEKISDFLKCVGVDNASTAKHSGNLMSRCPFGPWNHENGVSGPYVFGVKIETGVPRAHCFACDWRGTLGKLLEEVRHKNKIDPKIEVQTKRAFELLEEAEATVEFDFDTPGIEEVLLGKRKDLHVFPDWWLESFPCAWDIPWARSYLQERKAPLWLAATLDIRADTKERRVCFPIRDFKKRLVGLHGRAVDEGRDPRYRMYLQAGKNNPIVWLGESWVDLTKPIVVVEGPFDLASVLRVYPNTVSPLFSNPSAAKLKRMSDCFEWLTFYDRGAGGDAGRAKVDAVLSKDHTIHHVTPPKPYKDPGECPVTLIKELLGPILGLPPETSCN